jgi:hypothetical protein
VPATVSRSDRERLSLKGVYAPLNSASKSSFTAFGSSVCPSTAGSRRAGERIEGQSLERCLCKNVTPLLIKAAAEDRTKVAEKGREAGGPDFDAQAGIPDCEYEMARYKTRPSRRSKRKRSACLCAGHCGGISHSLRSQARTNSRWFRVPAVPPSLQTLRPGRHLWRGLGSRPPRPG